MSGKSFTAIAPKKRSKSRSGNAQQLRQLGAPRVAVPTLFKKARAPVKAKVSRRKVDDTGVEAEAEEDDEDDEDDNDSDEDTENFEKKIPLLTRTRTALQQTRSTSETAMEPFCFLDDEHLYTIWYKNKNISMEFEVTPKSVEVDLTSRAPTLEEVHSLSTGIPGIQLNALTTKFALTLCCKVWPNTVKKIDTDLWIGFKVDINPEGVNKKRV